MFINEPKGSKDGRMLIMMITLFWGPRTVICVEGKELIDMNIRDNRRMGTEETAFQMSISHARTACLRPNQNTATKARNF
jgi:hypothetical protein